MFYKHRNLILHLSPFLSPSLSQISQESNFSEGDLLGSSHVYLHFENQLYFLLYIIFVFQLLIFQITLTGFLPQSFIVLPNKNKLNVPSVASSESSNVVFLSEHSLVLALRAPQPLAPSLESSSEFYSLATKYPFLQGLDGPSLRCHQAIIFSDDIRSHGCVRLKSKVKTTQS